MGLAHHVARKLGKAAAPLRAGDERLASRELHLEHAATATGARERPGARGADLKTLAVASAFPEGGVIPTAYTVDGGGFAPPITWDNVPVRARSIVLICEDPDAPAPSPFVHWLVYGMPASASASSIESTPAYGHEGKNSLMKIGYTPPAPPPGHGVHRYHFQIFALDTDLDLEAGAGRSALLDAMKGHVVAWGETIGSYARR